MKIKEISQKLIENCKAVHIPNKKSKEERYRLYLKLEDIKIKDEEALKALLSLHRELFFIRNRRASYLENEMGRLLINRLVSKVRWRDKEIPEDTIETLKEDYTENDRLALRLSSIILKYGKEIIESKEDKSKRYKNRVTEAIRWLDGLQNYYKVENIKEIFFSKVEDKDEDLQFFALCGLENYYAHSEVEPLTKEEEERLESIMKTTKTRETVTTCCQILINTGKIEEFGAMMRVDNWKDKNLYS